MSAKREDQSRTETKNETEPAAEGLRDDGTLPLFAEELTVAKENRDDRKHVRKSHRAGNQSRH